MEKAALEAGSGGGTVVPGILRATEREAEGRGVEDYDSQHSTGHSRT